MIKKEGKNKNKKVKLFALSTCIWCKKTKELLDKCDIEYEYEFVDECTPDEKEKLLSDLDKYNPKRSYPTIVIDNEVVVGFQEDKIKELLGL